MLKRVQSSAVTERLWQPGARILVAVSGGPDSVCLLDMLVFLSRRHHFSLAIAHVNYQLREPASLGDENFVKELAKKYSLPCFIERYPHASLKRDENTLRLFRSAFFQRLVLEHAFDTIALGHHAHDQAETFLLHLVRGAGPLGLCGMLPKHGLLIRPLLNLTRPHILDYLKARELPFRVDASNADTRYTRNRIRHELLPLLAERFNPNIIATLARSAALFQEVNEESLALTCPITPTKNAAHFSTLSFCLLSSHEQRSLLRGLIRNLSRGACIPTQSQLNECLKISLGNKAASARLQIGALKLSRKNARVSLFYPLN